MNPSDTLSPHSARPLPWPESDAALVSFLPLVWVAWSDGDLSPAELETIRGRLRAETALPADSTRVLESWLRPEAPPSPTELAALRERIRSVAERVPASERRSLARLGAAMARTLGEEGGEGGAHWSTEGGMRTLVAIEDLLGVLGGESARALLDGETPPDPGAAPTATPPAAGDGAEADAAASGAATPAGTTPAPPPDPAAGLPAFDVSLLGRELEGEHGELRARVLALLEQPELAPLSGEGPEPVSTAAHREHVLTGLQRLADEGFGILAFPDAVGGKGDVAGSVIAFETLGYGDLSLLVKFGVQFGLFGGSVYQLGTARHHDRWLGRIGRLELPGCYAMTEVGHGSNVRDLETVARYLPDEDAFEVHTPHAAAQKDWIGNAALHGRMATVFAQLEVDGEGHGVHAFLVPLRDDEGQLLPGIHIEDCGRKAGLNGIDNGRIGFDQVRIPRDNLLDRFGRVTSEGRYESPIPSAGRRFFTMLGTLVAGRISIAAAGVSASKSALAIAVRYSDVRRQFGPSGAPEVPVLDYLEQQRLLLPRVAECYALHFAVRDLVARYARAQATRATEALDGSADAGTDEERSRIDVAAAGLKAYGSRAAVETVQAAREACGGRGYLAANRFGDLRADTDIFTTFEGANVVLLQLVAKGLLSRYREEMGDMNLRTMVRYLAERAGSAATRRNPVRSRRTSEDYLLDPGTHLDAFRFREDRLLQTVARRLKSLIDDGVDSFEAMNRCQDHLVALARAHVETDVLERFHEAAADAPEEGHVRTTLTRLAALWALWRLEADRAWFLEAGYMEPAQTKAIRARVNGLCRSLRPRAVDLVDAFGIPDGVLRAPAAFEGPDPR
jgi:acyl-CoA oxidase